MVTGTPQRADAWLRSSAPRLVHLPADGAITADAMQRRDVGRVQRPRAQDVDLQPGSGRCAKSAAGKDAVPVAKIASKSARARRVLKGAA